MLNTDQQGLAQKRAHYYESREGFCRICSEKALLTFDHVPPKGCAGIGKRNVHTLASYLWCEETKPRHAQSGMKFRSLCPRCNNTLLGHEYDPSLREFANRASMHLRVGDMNITLPDVVHVDVKPQRIARAIIGHLLAADMACGLNSPPNPAPFPSAMQTYFLDPSSLAAPEMEIFYWLYPSDVQVIINFCGIMALSVDGCILGCFLKFYPLAFWVIWDRPKNIAINRRHLLPIRSGGIDDVVTLPISLRLVPRTDWPENPSDDLVMLGHDQAVFFATKPKRKRK